jgi:hypothetical protein
MPITRDPECSYTILYSSFSLLDAFVEIKFQLSEFAETDFFVHQVNTELYHCLKAYSEYAVVFRIGLGQMNQVTYIYSARNVIFLVQSEDWR